VCLNNKTFLVLLPFQLKKTEKTEVEIFLNCLEWQAMKKKKMLIKAVTIVLLLKYLKQ